MKHCDACTVDFTGDMARCPLCQNELRGEASPAAFPAQQIYLRPRRLAVEIITFVTGAILLLHGFFSYLFSWPIPIASASILVAIASRKNSLRSIRTLPSGQTSSFSPFSLTTSRIIFPPISPSCINAIQ